MLIDRPQVSEGSVIVNATLASGAAFPSDPNAGELFYLTAGAVGLYSYNGTGWDLTAKQAVLAAHMADDTRHLTPFQNTLFDGLASTLTSAELNFVDGVTSAIQTQLDGLAAVNGTQTSDISNLQTATTATQSALTTHIADDTKHLTAAQNNFMDALTVTSTQVNSIPALTTRMTNNENALTTHVADDTKHLTAAQNTFLDGLTITVAEVNKLNGLASFLAAAPLTTYLGTLIARDGTVSMTGTFNFGSQKGINLATPTNAADAANKSYVDGLIQATSGINVQSIVSNSVITPTFLNDMVKVTALAVNTVIANPTGTPQEGWGLVIRIRDNGTPRTLTFGSQYRVVGTGLPTATVPNKLLYISMIYNDDDTKWDVVAVGQEG